MTDKRVSHLDDQGQAHMVDVGAKPITPRRAQARAQIRLRDETLDLVLAHGLPKGDVFATARRRDQAAKRTA
jgi:cyclic pyranopterin phosphate synthase